ncbi:MAG: alpha/beta hydrolase [Caulobacter sp.]|nr:alpha/beta hydrolase [Vitreoscilla sp.]
MSHPIADAIGNAVGALRADKDMKAVLDQLGQLTDKHIEDLDPAAARLQPTPADAVKALLASQGRDSDPLALVPGVTTRDISIPGPGGALSARVFTPAGPGPFPLVVYFHGGGWVIADKTVYDGGARGLSEEANALVVSVDYRRSPEAKFPAAWDDALASYTWVSEHAQELNGNAARIALAGESAGGNLALATAIAARDRGLARQPCHVLAVYPVTQTSLDTESYLENAVAKPLNRAMVEWFVDKLINSKDDLKDKRLQLIDADLSGLPGITIISADIDPLRSDGAQMEDALRKARVPVERRNFDGVTHEFFGMSAVVEKAREAQAWAGDRLLEAFASA